LCYNNLIFCHKKSHTQIKTHIHVERSLHLGGFYLSTFKYTTHDLY
jgi:hypothetical protein